MDLRSDGSVKTEVTRQKMKLIIDDLRTFSLLNYEEIDINTIDSMDSANNNPYQCCGWLDTLYEAKKANGFKRFSEQYLIATWELGGKTIIVAPIVLFYIGKYREGVLPWGYDLSTDYTDFIYAQGVEIDEIEKFILQLLAHTKRKYFYFSSLPEKSMTYFTITSRLRNEVIEKHICVSILLGGINYEEWFKGLSKSVRQNIRTGKNRLLKDGKIGDLIICNNTELSRLEVEEMQSIYEKRRKVLNQNNTSFKGRLVHLYRQYRLSRYSYMAETMLKNKESEIIKYCIDGRIAAFGHALINKSDKSPTFMQICYNNDFGWYSPGMLMLSDYIKVKCGDVKFIDLALGDEKYKYDLGGVDHYTYSIKVYQ